MAASGCYVDAAHPDWVETSARRHNSRIVSPQELVDGLDSCLTKTLFDQAVKDKQDATKAAKIPRIPNAQNLLAGLPEMRDTHETYVKTTLSDLSELGIRCELLDVHRACRAIRNSVDPEFTDFNWQPRLPGDKIPIRETKNFKDDISNILWPPLAQQLIPRDGNNIDLRTARIGDQFYGSVFIDLFHQEILPFMQLFKRILPTQIPWRISFMIESDGMRTLGIKPTLAAILAFASNDNRLLSNASNALKTLQNNSDEAIVALRVTATTWANYTDDKLLKTRVAELSKRLYKVGAIWKPLR